jgi:hypothetical protein
MAAPDTLTISATDQQGLTSERVGNVIILPLEGYAHEGMFFGVEERAFTFDLSPLIADEAAICCNL